MTKPQGLLLQLLADHDPALTSLESSLNALDSGELAEVYVDVAFLGSATQFLREAHWLENKRNPQVEIIFSQFISTIFKSEFSPLKYLQLFFEESSLKEVKRIGEQATRLEMALTSFIQTKDFGQQKIFASRALAVMSGLFEFEHLLQLEKKSHGEHLGLSLYRTFDRLDEIFNLNYNADEGMKTDLENTERLYEGAGVGVQSGYSTVVMAIQHLNPSLGSRFIDLGSGYGRVGLVVGLLRPDIDFIGYEFVQHRVDIAAASSANLDLQDHVHFYTQDLSLANFRIPDAEVYYLYDPFSEETYGHVLNQLIEISRQHKISIVTKGNARGWLLEIAKNQGWKDPEEFDSGNLCLFHSA